MPRQKQKSVQYFNLWNFLLGALVGLAFFTLFYGLAIVNPTATDWIWQGPTHDTAQHFLGWQFYRADGSGATINGLAYPQGLSIVFMDVIPLLAIPFKLVAQWLPTNFQYFGMWGLLCYLLMGGLAGVLVGRIWRRVAGDQSNGRLGRWLFVMAGSLIFVLSPMVMARSFYHPALAGQWLILLGFLLILDTPKFTKWWKLLLVWSLVLVMSVLIHPYFLPMMGVLMVLSVTRYWSRFDGTKWRRWVKALACVIVPAVASLAVFYLVGGFSQGSGSEVHDLEDKGFNLLSFVNPLGYSGIMPEFPNRSYSAETLMWLGLGVIVALAAAASLWVGRYQDSFRRLWYMYRSHRGQCWFGLIFCVLLLIFAIGTCIDLGPITLAQYSVPEKVYELWSAFRAAAREAWPFYYGLVLLAVYWLALAIRRQNIDVKRLPLVLAMGLIIITAIQTVDILSSPKAQAKYEAFVDIADKPAEFQPFGMDDIIDGQKHMIALDDGFRGDQSGTYIIGRTALKHGMTLNTGFFARVSDEVKADQAEWRERLNNFQVTDEDFRNNLFFTKDKDFANHLSDRYSVAKYGDYYFVSE